MPAKNSSAYRAKMSVFSRWWYTYKAMRITDFIPPKKGIFKLLLSGFELLPGFLGLILLPIGIDLFMLFGPRLNDSTVVSRLIQTFPMPSMLPQDLIEGWEAGTTALKSLLDNLSLTCFLRTFPLGVPSLLAWRGIGSNPLGHIQVVETPIGLSWLVFGLGFTFIGWVLVSILYYLIGKHYPSLSNGTKTNLPFVFTHLSLFNIMVLAFLLMLAIPGSFIVSLLYMLHPVVGIFGYMIGIMLLISILLPSVFTPQAITIDHLPILHALRKSFMTSRKSRSFTSLFLIMVMLVAYLSRMLWQVPPDNSWMILVGIFGHALVSIALILSMFEYYKTVNEPPELNTTINPTQIL